MAQRVFGVAAFHAAKYGNWTEVDSVVATARSMGLGLPGGASRWVQKLAVMREKIEAS